MSGQQHRSTAANLTAVAAGAGVGGVLAWTLAPKVFWAFLIGGALLGGAIRVGVVLFTQENGSSRGS